MLSLQKQLYSYQEAKIRHDILGGKLSSKNTSLRCFWFFQWFFPIRQNFGRKPGNEKNGFKHLNFFHEKFLFRTHPNSRGVIKLATSIATN